MQYKSALITEATGHINGLVASHNRWGAYFRPRVTPVNPNSDRQNAMRSYLADAVQLWQDLTAEQRSLWDQWAANTPQKNRLGQDITLTGQLAYIKSNTPKMLIGDPPVADPPAEYNNGQAVTPDPDTWEFNIDTDTWSITVLRQGPESVDGKVLTFRGIAQNPSRGFYAGPYQLSDVEDILLAAASATPTATIGVDDLCDYAIPETPARIPMRFVVIYADGRYSHTERTLIIPTFTTTGA